jgi:hypothetical protein
MAIGDKLKNLFCEQPPPPPWLRTLEDAPVAPPTPDVSALPPAPEASAPPPAREERPREEHPRPEYSRQEFSRQEFSRQIFSHGESPNPDDRWTNDVAEIYAKSSIAQELKNDINIFKVQQLIDTLPKDLGKSAIQSTLGGIFGATGIAVAALERDAALRKGVLDDYLHSSVQEMDAKSEELRRNISDAEQIIESARQELSAIRSTRANIEQSVAKEMKTIDELASFLAKS